jgi:hypothetical protein
MGLWETPWVKEIHFPTNRYSLANNGNITSNQMLVKETPH